MATVTLTVNGQSVTADVDPRTLLVQFLRENLRLTGTHVGCDTSQCGYCTPGMIMAAVDLVNRKGHSLDEQTIRAELEGNLCRCTGYHNIVKAVAAGALAMAQAPLPQ